MLIYEAISSSPPLPCEVHRPPSRSPALGAVRLICIVLGLLIAALGLCNMAEVGTGTGVTEGTWIWTALLAVLRVAAGCCALRLVRIKRHKKYWICAVLMLVTAALAVESYEARVHRTDGFDMRSMKIGLTQRGQHSPKERETHFSDRSFTVWDYTDADLLSIVLLDSWCFEALLAPSLEVALCVALLVELKRPVNVVTLCV